MHLELTDYRSLGTDLSSRVTYLTPLSLVPSRQPYARTLIRTGLVDSLPIFYINKLAYMLRGKTTDILLCLWRCACAHAYQAHFRHHLYALFASSPIRVLFFLVCARLHDKLCTAEGRLSQPLPCGTYHVDAVP